MTESNPTAYREAGHAVAAFLLTDCPFDTVTIVPGEPSVGAVARQHLLDDDDIALALEYGHEDEIRRNRSRIEDTIRVSLAGPYAQRRHDPASKWRRGKDLKEASDLIYCLYKHYHTPAKVIPSFWRHTNVILDDFLEGHWNAHRDACAPSDPGPDSLQRRGSGLGTGNGHRRFYRWSRPFLDAEHRHHDGAEQG